LIPLYENMPGGSALKPGDVVFSHKGVHVRIENTANEGRVVLSDVLSYSKDYNPKMIINVATLSREKNV
jgi:leucyl aminopeptidase